MTIYSVLKKSGKCTQNEQQGNQKRSRTGQDSRNPGMPGAKNRDGTEKKQKDDETEYPNRQTKTQEQNGTKK